MYGGAGMTTLYLITGATGHVGTVLVRELLRRGGKVRALVLPGEEKNLPAGVEYTEGDITKPETMKSFFSRKARTEDTGFDRLILIHCAAIITVATATDPRIYQTNVTGTENVMRLARQNNVDRIICLSSVHAIPEKPKGEVITEVAAFSPEKVDGQYAKTKAEAANIVLGYARQGLNVSIVHPSGVIGPGDLLMKNHMIRVLRDMASGRIPVAVQGGYDFVDSRDVAAGILACAEKGRAGECYILSGHYITVQELLNQVRRICGKKERKFVVPYRMAMAATPFAEWFAHLFGRRAPVMTPYSVRTLHSNGHFSCEKARRELGYHPRDPEETIRDSLQYIDAHAGGR